MDFKRFIALSLLLTLGVGVLPLAAFAEDDVGTVSDSEVEDSVDSVGEIDDSTDDSTDDSSDDSSDDQNDDEGDDNQVSDADSDVDADETSQEVEDEIEDVEQDAVDGEGDEIQTDEGTTVVAEEVDESDLSDEMEQELEDAATSGEAPDQFYLAVMWGYFGSDAPSYEATTWDGTISIDNEAGDGVFARPVKKLMFEKEQDSIDFDNTTVHETAFSSTILNRYDGILFKVRTDLGSADSGKVTFDTDYSTDQSAAYLSDLVTAGGAEFVYGNYKVVMKVVTREQWIEAQSNSSDKSHGRFHPTDTEEGAWYNSYMNAAIDMGAFTGMKDMHGKTTGQMDPSGSLTRFQLLKVAYELSDDLNVGVGAGTCDPATVSTTSSTDWLSDNWVRGYVQCIEDSGVSVTLLDSVIADTLANGNLPALRWEVVITIAELLELDTSKAPNTDLSDVDQSGLGSEEEDAIDFADETGVISGYPDGTFKPYKTVNRAEMFKIISLFKEVVAL